MEKLLLIQVCYLDDRYHGEGDWPPSPARLLQALVAGNAVGARLPDDCIEALKWLETVPGQPEIRAQRGCRGLAHTTFVPNNDLDAKGGDPDRIADIRVGKTIHPRHIDASKPISYLWRFTSQADNLEQARRICAMADNLYQLGRGWDMAWARAELLDDAALDELPGDAYRPGGGTGELELDCPQAGSLASLLHRYQARRDRFSRVESQRKTTILFTQPPKPRFKRVTYNPDWRWRLFDLRVQRPGSPFRAWSQDRVVALVEAIREAAAQRLGAALPDLSELVERLIIGRNASAGDQARRVRIIPLPSIGHEMTSRAIRRVLVMVPDACPLAFGDIEWTFSGLTLDDNTEANTALVPAEDLGMLRHYALESGDDARLWRTVTPMALPRVAARRRVDPQKKIEQAKPGSERLAEEQHAGVAVLQALRHAKVHERVAGVRVQREPFSRNGKRAEAFADATRFAKECLWHVEIRFASPIEGPLLAGDGRYLGLGLMAPQKENLGALAFCIEAGLATDAKPESLAQALRRAIMARVQQHLGANTALPPFFTGHDYDGGPLQAGNHKHLAFVADLERRRLLVIAPHTLEARRSTRTERESMNILDEATRQMNSLRAGCDGHLRLAPATFSCADDPVLGSGRVWESLTDYKPTRHAKKVNPEQALTIDILQEVDRHGLPRPKVTLLHVYEGPRGGLAGRVRLLFPSAQPGPIIIGKTRHVGGGVFKRLE